MDIVKIVKAFKLMAESELAVAEMYNACAIKWPEDSDFWESFMVEENIHAEKIEKMAGLIENNSRDFTQLQELNPFLVQMFIDSIQEYTQRIQEHRTNKEHALILARDVENSIIENKFLHVLESANEEYENIKMEILSQTARHKKRIIERLKQI